MNKLAAQVPAAKLEVVPEAMRSLRIERPDTCAALIRTFVLSRDFELSQQRRAGGATSPRGPPAPHGDKSTIGENALR